MEDMEDMTMEKTTNPIQLENNQQNVEEEEKETEQIEEQDKEEIDEEEKQDICSPLKKGIQQKNMFQQNSLPQLTRKPTGEYTRLHDLKGKELNFLVSRKPWDEKCFIYMVKIIEYLSKQKVAQIYVDQNQYNTFEERNDKAQEEEKQQVMDMQLVNIFEDEEKSKMDFIITIGGDGNLLWISKLFQKSKVPTLISFAAGTRNFLCYYLVDDYVDVLNEFFQNINNNVGIKIDRRKRLHAILKTEQGEQHFQAFNDLVIERDGPGLARMDIYLNDEFFLKLLADGLIVSTSSGSTAYSLSAGGSILHPQVYGTILTPICSITTSIKPVVIPEFIEVKVQASKNSRSPLHMSIDGHTTIKLKNTDQVIMKTSQNFPLEFYIISKINPLTHWVSKLGKIYHYQNPT